MAPRNAPGKTSNKVFEVVLFDLGHTLIYFDGAWSEVFPHGIAALVDNLRRSGYPLDPMDFDLRFNQALQTYYTAREADFIEFTTLYVLRRLLAEIGYTQVPDEHLRPALQAMYAVSQARWRTEVETHPTLRLLQQRYRLGLISNAADDLDVQALIDNAGLRPYFDVLLTSAAVGIRKPHPKIFHMALDHWGIPPERAVMVGDTLGADILGAQNAGLSSVWVTRWSDRMDNRTHDDTILPDAAVESLAELPELLENWERRPALPYPLLQKKRSR